MSFIQCEHVASAIDKAGLSPIPEISLRRLAEYTNLLVQWNAKINLTAIRDAANILERHIVESVAVAQALPKHIKTLMDYGTGAGLPGVPIAILRKDIQVTLAESQSKKIAFLREIARSLHLQVSIHPGRVQELTPTVRFDAITLRAVDSMAPAIRDARNRLHPEGLLVLFATDGTYKSLLSAANSRSHLALPLPAFGTLLICTI